MTRLPAQLAIDAVESRLIRSRLEVRQSLDRTRAAVRTAVARPSTVALVALASGVSAFLVSRRLCPAVKSVAKRAEAPTSAVSESSPGIVRTLVSVYGAAVLSYVAQLCASAWKQYVARLSEETTSTSTSGYSTTSERDH